MNPQLKLKDNNRRVRTIRNMEETKNKINLLFSRPRVKRNEWS